MSRSLEVRQLYPDDRFVPAHRIVSWTQNVLASCGYQQPSPVTADPDPLELDEAIDILQDRGLATFTGERHHVLRSTSSTTDPTA